MERVPGKLEVVAAVLGVKRTGKGHHATSDALFMPCIGYALFPSSKKKYYILAIEILFSMWNAFEFTQSSFYIVSWITPIE